MKSLIRLAVLFAILFFTTNGTDCPAAKEVPFSKLMNAAFANDYQNCPVITHAEFYSPDRLKVWVYPSKINKQVIFQCINVGSQPKSVPLSGEAAGESIVIDKDKSDIVFNLKKGDKVKLTGVTYVKKLGAEIEVYFIASSVEKE